MLGYLRDHWRGNQPLAWAFWVNLVALRLALFVIQHLLAPAKGSDYSDRAALVLALSLVVNGPLLVWQIVGVIRACDRFYRHTGSQALVWGAQLSMVLIFFLTATYALQSWQFTIEVPDEENFLTRMDREHAEQYSLVIEGNVLRMSGSVELGSTRRIGELLQQNPTITTVILESDGGNIYEGRGLARLFSERQMETRVETRCSSACTIAFSGGARRSISRTAKLGFHQYKMDADYEIVVTNPRKEQERDLQRFRQAGFSEAFLARIFASHPQQMWFPDHDELLQAGVVHEIGERTTGNQ